MTRVVRSIAPAPGTTVIDAKGRTLIDPERSLRVVMKDGVFCRNTAR